MAQTEKGHGNAIIVMLVYLEKGHGNAIFRRDCRLIMSFYAVGYY